MSTTADKTVESIATEAVATQGVATFEQLTAKPRRSLTFPVTTADADGNEVTVTMKYLAISAKRYDELVQQFPPNGKDRQMGSIFDLDSFAPALIAEVSAAPKLTVEQARELWNSPDWANGEVTSLFMNAQRVCNGGIDVPFNGRD